MSASLNTACVIRGATACIDPIESKLKSGVYGPWLATPTAKHEPSSRLGLATTVTGFGQLEPARHNERKV